MGLRDRLADLVASVFVTAPDHPGSGGFTGDRTADDEDDPEEGDRGEGDPRRD